MVQQNLLSVVYFNPRSPWGERPKKSLFGVSTSTFQSTLSVRRATWFEELDQFAGEFQSTLSVRRATHTAYRLHKLVCISIHALREESDVKSADNLYSMIIFQSTLSVRRATRFNSQKRRKNQDFNPRSPWGERLHTHTCNTIYVKFQSTLSVRRATKLR